MHALLQNIHALLTQAACTDYIFTYYTCTLTHYTPSCTHYTCTLTHYTPSHITHAPSHITHACTLTHYTPSHILTVDGGLTAFSDWTACSVSCANGTQSRERTCTQPEPQFGGLDCEGVLKELRACFERHCPIHCEWLSFSDWSLCSKSCDGGTRERIRNLVPAQYEGDECEGDRTEVENCNTQDCPGKKNVNLLEMHRANTWSKDYHACMQNRAMHLIMQCMQNRAMHLIMQCMHFVVAIIIMLF